MIKKIFQFLYTKLPESNRLERIWKIAQVDFKRRYYNDRLGILWALANPISQIFIYYFVFTRIFQRGEPNFALYLFSSLIVWLAFSEATATSSLILKRRRYLLENIQFDWMDLFYSNMISVTIGFSFNLLAYLLIALFSGTSLGVIHLFPLVLFSWFLITLSTSLLLGLIRPVFDDIIHIWNILLMLGFWTSGIFFGGEFFFEIKEYTWFAYLNPFVGIILNTRACLLEGNDFYMITCINNIIYSIIFFVIALRLFRKNVHKIVEKL